MTTKLNSFFPLVLASVVPVGLFAQSPQVSVKNKFLEIKVHALTHRISIKTKDGQKQRGDENKAIIDASELSRNKTYISIDGVIKEFGRIGDSSTRPKTSGKSEIKSSWTYQGVEVEQSLELWDNNHRIGDKSMVKIRYWIKNTTKESKKIGLRVLLAKKMGEGIFIPGGAMGRNASQSEVYSGDGVPPYLASYDTVETFRGRMLLSFRGGKEGTRPDSLAFGKYADFSDKTFSGTPVLGKYRVKKDDEAINLNWDPIEFPPGYENGVIFYVGISGGIMRENNPLGGILEIPEVVLGDETPILVFVQNISDSEFLKDLKVRVEAPPEIKVLGADGSSKTTIADLKPLITDSTGLRLKATKPGKYKIKVTVIGVDGRKKIRILYFLKIPIEFRFPS